MLGVGCLLLAALLVDTERYTKFRHRSYYSFTRGFAVVPRDDGSWSVARMYWQDAVDQDLWHATVHPRKKPTRTFDLTRVVHHSIDWIKRDGLDPPPLSPEQARALRSAIVTALDRDDVQVDPQWRSRFLAGEGVSRVVRWQGYAEWGLVIGLVAASLAFFWRAIVKRAA
jgi:hypothetical protein